MQFLAGLRRRVRDGLPRCGSGWGHRSTGHDGARPRRREHRPGLGASGDDVDVRGRALPKIAGSIGGNAVTVARDATGVLLVGGWQIMPAKKGNATQNRPDALAVRRRLVRADAAHTSRGRDGRCIARDESARTDRRAARRVRPGRRVGRSRDTRAARRAARRDQLGGHLHRGRARGQPVVLVSHRRAVRGTPSASRCRRSAVRAVARRSDSTTTASSSARAATSRGDSRRRLWRLDLSGAVPVLLGGPQRLPGLGVKRPTATSRRAPSG